MLHPSSRLEPVDRVPPAAGKRYQLNIPTRNRYNTCITSNRQWTRLGTFVGFLLISGIEENPGPSQTSYPQQTCLISHININSITTPGKLDKLQQFVDANDVQTLTLTEFDTNRNKTD